MTGRSGTAEARAARRVRVAELTREGLSARQIAERVGISTRRVVEDRVKAGVAGHRPRRFTDAELAQAKSMLEDGAGYNEAARTLGCCHESLRQRFPGMGLSADETRERRELARKAAEIEHSSTRRHTHELH